MHTASKEVEFDTAHRVPDHASKCRHLHGHRYRLRVTITGDLVATAGAADRGMVIDFGVIKHLATERVHDVLDHRTVLADFDDLAPVLTAARPDDVVLLPFIPTAENLAAWVWDELDAPIRHRTNGRCRLELVELWETPTSLVTYRRPT